MLDSTKSPVLAAQSEDCGTPSGAVGTLVSSLVDFAIPAGQVDNITDTNSGALLGIAVTAVVTANGSWHFSTNNGTTWAALGTVANNNARLLAADANSRLYFQPNTNYNGTLATAITFRAWDRTSGANGALASTATSGGNTAFSTATDTASLAINAVNDAPVLDNTKSPVLTAQSEDGGAPAGPVGTLVSSLVDFASPAGQVDNVTDVDSGALLGIAVMAADTANGSWHFSTNNGTTWAALGVVADNNARLLFADANSRLYFQPNTNYNGTLATAITFRAWDRTSGANGALASAATTGGTNAFSSATDTASLVINPVNDAPSGADRTLTAWQAAAFTFGASDFGFSDPTDSGANALLGVRITTLPRNGFLTSNTVAVAAGQTISATDLGAGRLQFTPAAGVGGSARASFTFQVRDNGGTANGGVDLDPSPNTITVDVAGVSVVAAGAPTAVGAEIRANTTTNDAQRTMSGMPQAVASDAAGNSVVVWSSASQDGSSDGVYAQRYDALGNAAGGEFRVNTTTTQSQSYPSVSVSAGGTFVISWSDAAADGNGSGVYAQRYNASGAAQGGEFRVNTFTTGIQGYSAVAMDAAGNFVIVWESAGQDGSGSGIYGQRYNAAGVAQGSEFQVNTTTGGNQTAPTVAMDAAGDFLVAWTDNTLDGSGGGIYAQRYNADGVAQGGEFRVNTTTSGDQRYASAAMAPGGESVITWSSDGQDGSGYGVFARRYDAAGAAQGGEIQANTTTSAFQGYSDVAMDGGGNFAISWSSALQDGSGSAVVLRRFAANGAPLSGELIANTTTTLNQIDSSVASDVPGGLVVVWQGVGVGDTNGVFLRRFEPVTTETNGTAALSVALHTQPSANVTIGLSSSDTTEATVSPASLTFTPANWNLPQTVTLTGVDDLVDDGDVAYSLVTSVTSSADPNYSGRNAPDFTTRNLDDGDTAGITISTRSGSETRVNATTVDFQYARRARALALDHSGNAVAVWSSGGQDGDMAGVFGRRVDAAGNFRGAEFQVNTTTVSEQFDPAVAMSANGDFVVVWTSDGQDGDLYGIYSQRYNAAGVALGLETQVNTTTLNEQSMPAVGMDDAGNYVVAWTSYEQDGFGAGVYAQRYNALGVPLGGEFRVNTTTDGDQSEPAIGMNGAGQFVITWTSGGQDGDGTGVYGRRYSAAGVAQGGEFLVNTTTTADQYGPSVAMNESGAFVVAWDSLGQDGSGQGVYLQRFDALGAKLGAEVPVNTYTTGAQLGSSVAWDPAGGFAVFWSSFGQDNGTLGVYGQRFTASGAPQGGEFRVNSTSDGSQSEPSAAFDFQGRLVVAWTGNGPGDDNAVFLQNYLPSLTAETGLAAGFSVVLDSQPTGDVTVGLASSDSGEGAVSPAALTFTPANWNTPRTVTVTGVNDSEADGNIDYTIITSVSAPADATYGALNPEDVPLTNIDDDTPLPVNPAWHSPTWSYRKTITIWATNLTANLTNFPVLINRVDPDLQAHALANGYDLLFTTADGTNKLAHEIESYTSSNGTLAAWVNVPLVSAATNTVLYLYYGNSVAGDQQNAPAVWDTNYVAVWHLKEDPAGAAPQMRDSTGFGNHGSAVGGLSATNSVPASANGGLYLDGVNDWVAVSTNSSLDLTGPGTVEAWFKLGSAGTWRSLVAKGDQDINDVHNYFLEFDTANRALYGVGNGSAATTVASTFTVTDTTSFHQMSFTWDGSNLRLYYDGLARQTNAQTVSPAANGAPLLIGQFGGNVDPYHGTLDEVRISRIARPAAWMGAAYLNQNAPATFSTVANEEVSTTPRLAIISVNGGAPPAAGGPFSVVIESQTGAGAPLEVTNDTSVALSLNTGAGTLGGTLTGVIPAGGHSVTLTGVTYTKAQSGVVLTASRASGDNLAAGPSASFAVLAGPVSAATSTVNASPATVTANGFDASTVTVTLLDACGNPVSGKTVALGRSGSVATISAASGASDASGRVTFSVRDTAGETVTLTATNTTDGVVITPTASVVFNAVPWFDSAWKYRKAILISRANLTATLTNFPVLISRTDADLRAHARSDGYDLLFTSADGTTKLAHEIERYTSSSGALVAWVKAPVLSATADTLIYLYYGNAPAANQQDGPNVWDAGFRAVWHFGESGGASLADSTLNANTGALAGSPSAPAWGTDGQIGNRLAFDGADDYLTIPHSASLNVSDKALTVSGWYRVTNTASDQVIFGKFYNADMSYPYYQYGLEFESSTRELWFFLGSGGAVLGPWAVDTTPGVWQYAAFTYDGTNVTAYLNGNAPAATPENNSITAGTNGLQIGEDNNLAQPFLGAIDELRVSGVARSAAWLAAEYANQSSPGSFCAAGGQELSSGARLAITAINGGAPPAAGIPFSVVVEARTATGSALSVTNSTTVSLSLHSGSGALGGTLTGTIPAGSSSVTLAGVNYVKAESGVILTASPGSGDSLIAGDSNPFTVNPGAVSAAQSTVTANPATVEANGFNTATITVILQDAHGNRVPGETVTLEKSGGSATISAASGPSDASGMVTFSVSDTVSESLTFTATDTTGGIPIPQGVAVRFVRSAWSDSSWLYRKAIVIPRTNVVADLTNFPVLISFTDSHLGGAAQTNGADLRFTSSDGTNRLAHEIESYSNSNGTLAAWVNVPLLSSTTDTTLFLYYGNASATNQQNAGGVWNADYKAVWHLSGGNFSDSTTNANHGVNSGTAATTGRIAEGRGFDGVNDYIYTTTRYTSPQTFTLEAWFRTAAANGANLLAYENNRTGTGSTTWDRQIYVGTDGKLHFECWSSAADDATSPSTHIDNAWHHVVAVRDDAASTLYLYVDGQLAATASSPNAEVANGYWRMGSYKPGTAHAAAGYFAGALDEARISFTPRSAAWVRTTYNNQSAPATFLGVSSPEAVPVGKLVITSVNGGASPAADTAFNVSVQAQTWAGSPLTVTNNTALRLTLASGGGTLSGTVTGLLAAGSSSATISGVACTRADSNVVLTVSPSSGENLAPGDSQPFTVNPGAFAKLQLLMPGETAAPGTATGKTGAPTARTAGSAFTLSVNAVDACWNLISTNDTVSLTSSDGQATLPPGAALLGGTRAFSVTLKTSPTQTVTAGNVTHPGITPGASTPVVVLPAAASALAFTTQPGSAAAGAPFGQQPVVKTQDQYGNDSTVGLAASLSVSITLTSGTGPLQGTTTLDIGAGAGNGSAAFTNLRIDPAGTKQLTAAASGLTSGLSATFDVANAGPVAATATYTRPRNVPLKIAISSLLTNVTDLNGDTITLAATPSTSTNGATLYTNGTWLLYTLPPGGNISDSFTNTVSDGSATTNAPVRISPREEPAGTNFNQVAYAEVDGKPTMSFAGIPGRPYLIQRTQDLTGAPVWTDLHTTNAPAGGLFQYVDPSPPAGNRIYRAVNQ